MSAIENLIVTNVEIELKGQKLKLVFDFNTVAEIESRTGRNLMVEDGWKDLNGTEISILFWATLQSEQPEITLNQTRKMMNTKNMKAITDKVMEAWSLSKSEEAAADPNTGLTAPAPAAL